MSTAFFDPTTFAGTARLFPLPNLVFFPGVVQPLHIFEPRYRAMTADALEGDKLIALALPKPGWEADYAGAPAIHPIACLGKIATAQRFEDGRYNLLLRGVSRVRIISELDGPTAYRTARVQLLPDRPLGDVEAEGEHRRCWASLAPRLFPHPSPVRDEFRRILGSDLPLGALADLIAFALPFDYDKKFGLLAQPDVAIRATVLSAFLRAEAPVATEYRLPDFSAN